jgi:WD40 repeat protein
MTSPSNTALASPYPGLRPFREDETHLFFGREQKIEEMLAKLEEHRFLAVIGTSGCGKSSLVRAGLLPALKDGFLSGAGQHWRMAIMRPGESPYDHLGEALLTDSALAPERGSDSKADGILQATLRRGPLGLVDAINDSHLPEDTSFLLVVDQFEEIFRYRRQSKHPEDADAFVRLMLSTADPQLGAIIGASHPSFFVIMTMRSDYIGDCALFTGLPEAINSGLFLTPRLNRGEYQAAIVEPARVAGGSVALTLANRLLNDVRAEPDQLPVLQHALMRMWVRPDGPLSDSKEVEGAAGIELELNDYEAVGGLSKALSNHADEALAELDPSQQRLAEVMFRSLCERGSDGRETRRPAMIGDIAKIANVPWEDLIPVVECFRQPDRSFIMPAVPKPLKKDTFLDISHESLIRQWGKLNGWVKSEADYAESFQRFAKRAVRWDQGQGEPLRGVDLELAWKWREDARPTPAWTSRYGGGYELTMGFLEYSRKAMAKTRLWGMLKLMIGFALALGLAVPIIWIHIEDRAASREHDHLKKVVDHAMSESESHPRLGLLIASDAIKEIHGSDREGEAPALRKMIRPWALKAMSNIYNQPTLSMADLLPEATGLFRKTLRRLGQPAQLTSASIHNSEISSLALNPDGDRIVSTDKDGVLILWDARQLTPIDRYEDHRNEARRKKTKNDDIMMVVFNHDGTRIATAAKDHTARIFDYQRTPDAEGLVHIDTIEHDDEVQAVAFSNDGRFVATASRDGTSKLWTSIGKKPRTLSGHADTIYTIAFSPNNKHLATASEDQTIKIWTTDDGKLFKTIHPRRGEVYTVAYSPDGKLLACGTYKGVALYDSRFEKDEEPSYRWINSNDVGTVYNLALDPKNRRLAAAVGKEINIWNINQQGQRITLREAHDSRHRPLSHAGNVSTIAFSPDGTRLVAADLRGTVIIWTSGLFNTLKDTVGAVYATAFSPDGRHVYAAGRDSRIRRWNATRSEELPVLVGHTDSVNALAFRQGKEALLATASNDGSILQWRTDTNSADQIEGIPNLQDIGTIYRFSPDGRRLAVATNDGRVTVWDVSGRRAMKMQTFRDHTGLVYALDFNADGNRLAAAGGSRSTVNPEHNAYMWDVSTGRLLRTFQGHSDRIVDVALDQQGRRLVTASWDNKANLWDTTTGSLLATVVGHDNRLYAAALAPDGSHLAVGGADRTAHIYKIDQQRANLTATVKGHEGSIVDLAFSPDGNRLATAGDDGTARLWDTISGRLISVLDAPTDQVVKVRFSPDGKRLAVAGADGMVSLNLVDPEDLVETGYQLIRPALKLKECQSFKPLALPSCEPLLKVGKTIERFQESKIGSSEALEIFKATLAETYRPAAFLEGLDLVAELASDPEKAAIQWLTREVRSIASSQAYRRDVQGFKQSLETLAFLNPSFSAVELKKQAAKSFILSARKMARNGDLDAAEADFRQAKEFNPELLYNPQEKAREETTKQLVYQADKLARDGALQQATINYRQALDIAPELAFDPEEKARQEASKALVREAEAALRNKRVGAALSSLLKAHSVFPDVKINNRILADICWQGVLQNKAELVLETCERSIKNDPDHGGNRDSRGVARAMTGDVDGAVDDFNAYVLWAPTVGRPQHRIDRRQRWIDQLQKGMNPFDDPHRAEELKALAVE